MQLAKEEIFKLIAEEVVKEIDSKIDWRTENTPEGFIKIIGRLSINFKKEENG